jgi:hypothetical protein
MLCYILTYLKVLDIAVSEVQMESTLQNKAFRQKRNEFLSVINPNVKFKHIGSKY